MQTLQALKPKYTIACILLLFSNSIFAQEIAVTKTAAAGSNLVEILMIVIALVLAFVIWGLGQVLIITSKQALEKSRQDKNKIFTLLMIIGLLNFPAMSHAQLPAAVEALKVTANYGGLNSTAFWILSIVLFIEIVAIVFILFSIRRIQAELLPVKLKTSSVALKEWWGRLDKKLFTKAVAVEKEADILLDHDYDGIKELDNSLPPWWKYGFIATIVVAFIYMMHFHVLGSGKNPTEEYQAELVLAQEQKEIYDAKNADKINESDLKMPDAAGLDAGKEVFTTACWACHGKQGEGGTGPNLTDDYWIHKGSLADVYFSVKKGYPDKGMQAWEKNYSPKEINNIAGYIKTLRGTNPANAKAAQGDLYLEEGTDPTIKKTDSTETVAIDQK